MKERRNSPRIAITLDSHLRVLSLSSQPNSAGQEFKGQITNLSASGACTSLQGKLESSDVVAMQFCLPHRDSPVKVYAEMVWSEPANTAEIRVGLRFLAIRDFDAALIANLNQTPHISHLVAATH
jgi:c-di-GMP-binding flagellar brake protein YcgR